MKEGLKIILLVMVILTVGAGASLATTVIEDSFETWTNASVASGWTGANVGGTGQFNQVYSAGQSVSCGGADTNYKAVYKDLAVRVPYFYLARVDVISNTKNASGVQDGTLVRMHLQFLDANGNVLATFIDIGNDLSASTYGPMEVSGAAPAGSVTGRITIQVAGGSGGGAVFKNCNIYEMVDAGDPNAVLKVGQNMTRSNEWLAGSKICQGWTKIEHGNVAGDFAMRATGGSVQGISCGGTSANYRQIGREFTAVAGFAYESTVEVVSSSMNSSGVLDPSVIVQYIEFMNSGGSVLATFQSPGNQYDIKPAQTTSLITNGTSPAGTTKGRITLRVFGGTGGGTVFDNYKLTQF